MSYENAVIKKSYAGLLTGKIQGLINLEAIKGCEPKINAYPVSLEPVHIPISDIVALDTRSLANDPAGIIPEYKEPLTRLKVWISPENSLNWVRSEQFLKSLTGIQNRAGFEIIGNKESIEIFFSAQPEDIPIIQTAFKTQFGENGLSNINETRLSGCDDTSWNRIALADFYPPPPYSHLFTQPEELKTCPHETIFTALSEIPADTIGVFQILFQPVSTDHDWHQNINILLDLEYTIKLLNGMYTSQNIPSQPPSGELHGMAKDVRVKAHNDKPIFVAVLRMAVIGSNGSNQACLQNLKLFANLFQHGGRPLKQLTDSEYRAKLEFPYIKDMFLNGLSYRHGFLLNSSELSGFIHLPPGERLETFKPLIKTLEPLTIKNEDLRCGTPIGISKKTGEEQIVCIPDRIRTRSTHIIARHGMGKSTLMEHMILHDIEKGAAVAVLDPHGDLIQRLIHLIPPKFVNRTILFDLGNRDYVPLWNPVSTTPGQDLSRTTDDLVAAIKNIVQGWGDRLENLLRHAIFALLHLPNTSLLDISNLLRKDSKESHILQRRIKGIVKNQTARLFWEHDFAKYNNQDLNPPKHKLSKLLVSGNVSLMLSQPENRINFREIMDTGKILLMDLSGIGAEIRELLGSFALSLLHITALSRSDTPIEERKPFHIYCDEAHRFLTTSIEDIIAETRKFGVNLTLAHQYLRQFDQSTRDGILTAGSTIIFNVDMNDARYLSKDLQGLVEPEKLATFEIGDAIARIGTDIVKIKTKDQDSLPIPGSHELIKEHSYKNYYRKAADIEKTIGGNNSLYGRVDYPDITDYGDEDFEYEEFD